MRTAVHLCLGTHKQTNPASRWCKLLAWSSVPWGTAGSLETLLPSPHWDPTSRVASWGPQGLDNWYVLRMLSISSASSQGPVSLR